MANPHSLPNRWIDYDDDSEYTVVAQPGYAHLVSQTSEVYAGSDNHEEQTVIASFVQGSSPSLASDENGVECTRILSGGELDAWARSESGISRDAPIAEGTENVHRAPVVRPPSHEGSCATALLRLETERFSLPPGLRDAAPEATTKAAVSPLRSVAGALLAIALVAGGAALAFPDYAAQARQLVLPEPPQEIEILATTVAPAPGEDASARPSGAAALAKAEVLMANGGRALVQGAEKDALRFYRKAVTSAPSNKIETLVRVLERRAREGASQ